MQRIRHANGRLTDEVYVENISQQESAVNIEETFRQGVMYHRSGMIKEAYEFYKTVLQANPQHTLANHNIAVMLMQLGKPHEALGHFQIALNGDPSKPECWLNFMDALVTIENMDAAKQLLNHGRKLGLPATLVAKLQVRLDKSAKPEDDSGAGQAFDLDSIDTIKTVYSDDKLISLLQNRLHGNALIHIALYKSGSTWLSKIMQHMYISRGWNSAWLVPAWGRRVQEIDPRFFFLGGKPGGHTFFKHQHLGFSEYTKQLILKSGSKVILQIRNIMDVAVSIADFHRNAKENGSLSTFRPKGIENFSREKLVDYVIDMEIPTWIGFLEGWLNCELVKQGRISVVSYEEMLENPEATVKRVVKENGLPFSISEIRKALDAATRIQTRKNKAVAGRGKTTLSEKQQQKIQDMVAYFDLPESVCG